MPLSWTRVIQSILHFIPCTSILIQSFHLNLGFSSDYFPSSFPDKTLYAPHLPLRAAYPPTPIIFFLVWSRQGVCVIKLLVMLFSPLSCYLVLHQFKYLPQSLSITKTNQFTLYRKTLAVGAEIHTKHIISVGKICNISVFKLVLRSWKVKKLSVDFNVRIFSILSY